MKRLVPIMTALFLTAGCDSQPIRVTTMIPYVRLAAIPGRPAAGYFELDIQDDPGALVAVTSPEARRIEMHETMTHGTMASMRPIARIPLHAGDRLVFAPGGRHLMIYDVDPAVRPGDEFSFTLNFERGPPRTLSATVRAAGEAD